MTTSNTVDVSGLHVLLAGQAVLRDISLTCREAELVCVVGPNGAGKSTLLRSLAGLVASTGSISVEGVDPRTAARATLAQTISFLPQSVELAAGFSVLEVVLLGRFARMSSWGGASAEDLAAANSALAACGVDSLRERRFDQLSGGERRRVLLAQVWCQNAKVALLDEPTAALDPAASHSAMKLLRQQCDAGKTVVVVSHDLDLALRYAHRLVVVANGKIVASGEPEIVLASAETAAAYGVSFWLGKLPSGVSFVVPQ